jgi:1-acyl-sn-glycerol-3-phosphate acyltransferase
MIPLLYLFPKKRGKILHYGNRAILLLLFAKVTTVGKPDERANLYLINHQGIVDIITLEALLNINLNWVAKKELFEVPWFGLLLKYSEMIAVDREDRRGLLKLLKDVKNSIEVLNRPIAIFPEGTRAKEQKLLPFKPGAKFIAEKYHMIVQPVVIVGSKCIVNEHEKTSIGGELKVIYMPSIDVSNAPKSWYEQLCIDMQNIIDQELEKNGNYR